MGISGQVRGQDPSDSSGNTVCRRIIMDLCQTDLGMNSDSVGQF